MALANFFDKAILSAATVLRNFDRESFARKLEANVIGLVADGAAENSPEGVLTAELAVDLLARFYPRLVVVASEPLADRLIAHARAINPAIDVGGDLGTATQVLALAGTRVTTSFPILYIGSSGWLVKVSPTAPVSSGSTLNPFAAGAAACFGAASVFRRVFAEQLARPAQDRAFTLSMLDLTVDDSRAANPELHAIDFGRVHFIGLGAIGNGAVWALARTPRLQGLLYLIDHELVDLTNLQRYILTRQGDEGRSKVAIAAAALKQTDIRTCPLRYRWGEYLRLCDDWHFKTVAVAVDSAEDRIGVQASLPRRILNAWTQPSVVGVSRHQFVGDRACLACLYLPEGTAKHEDEQIAEEIGLPGERDLVRHLLHTGKPVERQLLERIALALKIPLEPLLHFDGQPLRVFHMGAVCSGLTVRLGATSDAVTEVPMAFQSAMAGIMLAAELVINAGGLRGSGPPVTTRVDLLRPPGVWSTNEKKAGTGRCLCDDPDYVAAYEQKYAMAPDKH